MKFLIIGEPCVDLIHKFDGSIIKSYGGILYSVISMSVLSSKQDVVIPVMNLGDDEYDSVIKILGNYSNIKTDGIYKVSHPTRKVRLDYTMYNSGHSARMETSTAPAYTLEFAKINNFLEESDAVLVNMISGVDITLSTMQNIRSNFNGYIHIDIHNLVMKTNEDGTRVHTNLDNWRQWCTNANTVQMNEFEVKSLSSKNKNEYEVAEEILLKHNSSDIVKGVIITKGKIGVSGYVRKKKQFGKEVFYDLDKQDINAVENPKFKDSTGCGDVFASSFTLDYGKNRDFIKALHYANRIASFNTSLEGIEELYKLK